MLTPAVARQSYGAAGRGDWHADSVRSATETEALLRGNTANEFAAPQELKRFYVETRPMSLWRHRNWSASTWKHAHWVCGATGTEALLRGNMSNEFVAPHDLKRFYVETRLLRLWCHKTFAEKGHLCTTRANAVTWYWEHGVRGSWEREVDGKGWS
jgi:hypothetical protein